MKYIVGLHGLPRSGKGVAASALADQHGFQVFSFGSAIYTELSLAFGVTEDELRSDEWKRTPQHRLANAMACGVPYREMLASMGEDSSVPRTSRYHLQRWATEYRRAQDNMYWTKKVDETARHTAGNIVFDDLRHIDSEYPYLRNLAMVTGRELRIVEIVRPGGPEHTELHTSDKHLPFHLIDVVLENINGHPEVIRHEISNYLYPRGD